MMMAGATIAGKYVASAAAAESAGAILCWAKTYSGLVPEGVATSHGHEAVSDLCTELDLSAKVKAVEALVSTVRERGARHENEAVRVAVANVEEALSEIKELGSTIDHKLDEFQECWFQRFRSPGIEEEMGLLRHYALVLDQRVDLLIKMLAIPPEKDAVAASRHHQQHAGSGVLSSLLGALTPSRGGSSGSGGSGGTASPPPKRPPTGQIVGVVPSQRRNSNSGGGGRQILTVEGKETPPQQQWHDVLTGAPMPAYSALQREVAAWPTVSKREPTFARTSNMLSYS